MKLDLNLFRVFDILMEVHSVSRAAERLGLTQSAVSHALSRLREQFDDPLFVRVRGGLRPTPRAHEIAPAVRNGLSLLRDAVARGPFEPASTTRTFTLSASSYFCVFLVPQIVRRARTEAPMAQFRIAAPRDDLYSALDEGVVDIALGGFERHPDRYARQVLLKERLVWIGCAGRGGEDLATRPRLTLARSPQPSAPEERMLREEQEPRAGLWAYPSGPSPVTIHDPLNASTFIAGTDLVTLLPSQLANIIIGRGTVRILGPTDQPDIELSMLWHSRATGDAAHVWLREVIQTTAAELES